MGVKNSMGVKIGIGVKIGFGYDSARISICRCGASLQAQEGSENGWFVSASPLIFGASKIETKTTITAGGGEVVGILLRIFVLIFLIMVLLMMLLTMLHKM